MNFRDFIRCNFTVLDGATGSFLQKNGLPVGTRPEIWNITNPEILIDIHKSYFDAGSNVVYSNTFGANLLNFEKEQLNEIINTAIKNVRIAAQKSFAPQEKFVAFDIGPTGKLLKPYGDLDFEEAVEIFGYSAECAEKAGADLIAIETMNDCYETKAALLAVKERTGLPVIVTNAYGEDSKLLSGTSPEAMVTMLEGLGADALGLNCSFGPDKQLDTIKRIVSYSSVPVIFKPNAGLPKSLNGKTSYDITAETFNEAVMQAVDFGVTIVGGCCGTTPEYIKNLRNSIDKKKYRCVEEKNITSVSSVSHSVSFGDRPLIIGERINPTGKKKIKDALRDNNIDILLKEGIEQQKCGADILDVNCGLPDIDEKNILKDVVSRLQMVSDCPLQIDTSDSVAMEKALRIYNGKPIINSVNGKKEVMDKIFPIVKKYGGVVVGLTLDENGIPETAEGRLRIAENIIEYAGKYDIEKKNLVFDPLTLTISSDKESALVTLESVRLIREKTDCNTILGVSNISFGLPEREKVNSTFFAVALNAGLSSAIINPCSSAMLDTYKAYLALSSVDSNGIDYIRYCESSIDEKINDSKQTELSVDEIKTGIIQGRKELSCEALQKFLNDCNSLEIINKYIIPALDEVGKKFEEKKLFLPQLLLSAEVAKNCFEIIKSKNVPSEKREGKLTVVLATVKGDIHDIGKNIVKLLLENYGYNVVDMGKDVPSEDIVNAVIENKASIVGLSALMTTTVKSMEETIVALRSVVPECKIVVGGAVLNKEYSEQIGADAYASDAMETVRYAESVLL